MTGITRLLERLLAGRRESGGGGEGGEGGRGRWKVEGEWGEMEGGEEERRGGGGCEEPWTFSRTKQFSYHYQVRLMV